jgi:1,2-diacylglycerol 3-beta-glucosyltransferase
MKCLRNFIRFLSLLALHRMPVTIPFVKFIVYTAAALYSLRTLVFIVGAWIERRKDKKNNDTDGDNASPYAPFVSVIVPARNEEMNIEACIRGLMRSTVSVQNFEVVAVNDRSTDRTGEILNGLQAEFQNLVVHDTEDDRAHSNLQGKPRALHQGITRSRGELILMTDADCIVTPTWIHTIAQTFRNPCVGLVAAFTVVTGTRFFDRLQMVEWMINNTMGSAGIGLGQPLGCFGNNLSVRRSLYDALGGYENIRFSVTEDLALLQAVHATKYQSRYVCAYETKIETLPAPDVAAFLKQHHRWINGGKALGWRGVVFVLSSGILWFGIVAAVVSGIAGDSWSHLMWLLVLKIVADYTLAFPSFVQLRMVKESLWMPLAEPFFLALELITPFLALQSNVEWKGQTLRNH